MQGSPISCNKTTSKLAESNALAKKLWEVSKELIRSARMRFGIGVFFRTVGLIYT